MPLIPLRLRPLATIWIALVMLPPVVAHCQVVHHWQCPPEGDGIFVETQAATRAEILGDARVVTSKTGPVLRLNGRDVVIRALPTSAIPVAPGQSLTIETTLRVFGKAVTGQILQSSPFIELEVRHENGAVSFNLKSLDNAVAVRCTGRTDIADGRWHDITAILDRDRGKLRLFVDGRLDVEVDDPTGDSPMGVPPGYTIGGRADGREMLDAMIKSLTISLGALEPDADIAADATGPTREHVLENSLVRMAFAQQGGRIWLASLIDKTSGRDYIAAATPSVREPNLWEVSLRSINGGMVLDEQDGRLSVTTTDVDQGRELLFRWEDLATDAEAFAVEMRALLPTDSSLAQWRIDLPGGGGEYGAWVVTFQRIGNLRKLSDSGDDFLAIPSGAGGGAGEGQLHRDPFETLEPLMRTYPCYHQSMQFNAWYAGGGGLYLGTHDGDANLKGFLFSPRTRPDAPPTMQYEVQLYPADAGVANTGFRMDYPAVVGTFQGDWYDACQIYRQWALDQKWCRLGQTWQRDDIAPQIKRGAYWAICNLDIAAPEDGKLMRKLARTLPQEEVLRRARSIEVESSMAMIREHRDYFDFPTILWSNTWYEGGGDMSPPRYLPMKRMGEFLETLHRELPDTTFSAYIAPKRYSVQVAEYDNTVRASLEHTPDGEPYITPPMPTESNDQHVFPCWGTDFWQDYWGQKSAQRARLGLDGFHVDELGSSTSFARQCFNPSHGHPVGGGTLYADTRRRMVTTMRDSARAVNPEFAIHHEVLSEIYIDVADLAEVCTSPTNNNIPMYEAVYHDYNLIMGRRIFKWCDRNLWPKRLPDDPDYEPGDKGMEEFVAAFGQTFIWGNEPGWTRVDIVSYAPKVAAFIKRFMQARYRAMDYLHFGRMMRPLTVTNDLPLVRTIWRKCDTPEHIMPAVLNSVWQAPNRPGVGIVLVNISGEEQQIAWELRHGPAAGAGDGRGPGPQAPRHHRSSVGDDPRTHTGCRVVSRSLSR